MQNASGKTHVRRVAVLGAGVMGAQIAAHLANAQVPVILFDLPAKEGDPNGIVNKALQGLLKLEPSPFSVKSRAAHVRAANYGTDLALLKDVDLVIEAIAERLDWKADLYAKVAPHLNKHCLFATNTSGLSISALAEALPQELRSRFCGVHFFNPPRYMALVELIPTKETRPELLDSLETFLTSTLGKGVVRAKDTPNFVANRVGVFSILATMREAEKFGLSFEVVDALTGPAIGRPKSATYRTIDVVGLDTLGHVIATKTKYLTQDPWKEVYASPEWMTQLIQAGALGQKSGAGVYKKVGKEIQVLDLATKQYRPSKAEVAPEVEAILKLKSPAEKFAGLRASAHPQAQFLWSMFRDVFQYCAVHLQEIAENARDVDLACRWGFGWQQGPFEIWQAAGWQQIAQWIEEDNKSGKTLANAPLPAWAKDPARKGVHGPEGSFSPARNAASGRSALPVYKRQPYPERVLGESAVYGKEVFENDGLRLWHTGDGIAVLSFKSKMHAIGQEVLDGVIKAVELAEEQFDGLVLWQTEPPFSAGANLQQILSLLQEKEMKKLEHMVRTFQRASMALKMSLVPTVAAVQGLALGGGCEFAMHCARAVAHLESYMGLVEAGVGVLPAGGGSKEFAMRSAAEAKGGAVFPFLQSYFQNVAMAKVSKSAEEAREMGFLRASDTVVFHSAETLHVAKAQARALAESNYRPPLLGRDIPVAGKGGIATLMAALVNMREGGFISDHDMNIGRRVATVLCGGEVEQGTLVSEEWLLELEVSHFMELLGTEKTLARIEGMLKTGKPVRN